MKIGIRSRAPRGWHVLASVTLIAALSGCGSSAEAPAEPAGKVETVLTTPDLKGQEIVVNTYGGAWADALKQEVVEPFEAATGAKVTLTTNCCDSFETQVKADQFAGDIVMGNDYGYTQSWGDKGLLKSDPRLSQIAKARGIDPKLYQDDVLTVGYYANVLAWNTKHKDNHPTSWAEFFDTKKFPGTRGLQKYAVGDMEVATMGSGTPAADVYPIDIDKALATLTALRQETKVNFWGNGADAINQLSTGELDYSLMFSNRVLLAIKEGLPIDMTFNQAVAVGTGAAIPTNAKNIEGAVAFLDFFLQPDIQAAWAQSSGMAPAFPDAVEKVDADLRKYMVTDSSNLSKSVITDNDWWRKNTETAEQKLTNWLSGS